MCVILTGQKSLKNILGIVIMQRLTQSPQRHNRIHCAWLCACSLGNGHGTYPSVNLHWSWDMIHICKLLQYMLLWFSVYENQKLKASKRGKYGCTWDYYDHEKYGQVQYVWDQKKRTMPVWLITPSHRLHIEPKMKEGVQ